MLEKLQKIQKELKAPKGQYNSFGKYKYRSAEDILEAVKPILDSTGCALTISDKVIYIGDRYYIQATVTLYDSKTGSVIADVCALAREDEEKKGQDSSQITGTASSYARKYALNGLFCIDDTKDADTDEYAKTTGKAKKTEKKESAEPSYRDKVIITAQELGISFKELAKDYGLNGSTTEERFAEVLKDLEGR